MKDFLTEPNKYIVKELQKMTAKEFNAGVPTHLIKKFNNKFIKDPYNKMAMNAVTRNNLQEISLEREILNKADFSFSIDLETGDISDQKQSGTCWMFADLNWIRTFTQNKFRMKSMDFSHNFVLFWDKLEKANFFFEQIINHIDEQPGSRKLHFLLHDPISDGGDWHMLVNLIDKYGLVPRAVMPDTINRENTRFMNEILAYKLREGAASMQKMHSKKKSTDALREKKHEILEEIYRILAISLGVPPKRFDWSYKDKDDNFHRELDITPTEFRDKYLAVDLHDIMDLINCPSSKTPFYKTYKVEFFNNMIGGIDYKWLNVPLSTLKRLAVRMLKDGKSVLFACDVLQESYSKGGLLYHNLYDFDKLFRMNMKMKKGTRLDFGQSVVTHAMVFTGVDIVNDKPVKWKVENSWGEKLGKKGYFIMSDEWFDEHVFDLAVPKEYLSSKQLEMFEQDPIILSPWSPLA